MVLKLASQRLLAKLASFLGLVIGDILGRVVRGPRQPRVDRV